RECGRRVRRHDHGPALLEGHDVRGRALAAALPGREEVRRRLRGGDREGGHERRSDPRQGPPRLRRRAPPSGPRSDPLRRMVGGMRDFFAVRVAAVGCVLALGSSVADAQTKTSESEASFNAGLAHLRENRPDLALEQFKKAIKEDPKNAYAYKGLGLTYLSLVRPSCTRNKSYPEPYLGFADAVGAMGHPDEAVAPLEGAIKEVPGQPDLLVALGQTYYKMGRFTEARTRLEEATRRDPSGPAGRRAAELLKNFPK